MLSRNALRASSGKLLARVLETPNLAAQVRALPGPALGKLIERVGLEDAGELVALATTGPQRLEILPGVPTVGETLPGIEVRNWYGALLPAAAQKPIVARLHAQLVKAMQTPEVRTRLASHGFDVDGSTPEQFAKFRKAEEIRWARVVKEAGIGKQ